MRQAHSRAAQDKNIPGQQARAAQAAREHSLSRERFKQKRIRGAQARAISAARRSFRFYLERPIMLEQQFVNALSLGCVYALFALGFTLVFGVLGVINLAHGAVFMVGAYAALTVVQNLALPLWAGLVAAFVVAGLTGVIIDYLVLKPLRKRNAPHLIPMIATIGVGIILNNAAQGIFGASNLRFPHGTVPEEVIEVAGLHLTVIELGIIFMSFALMAVLMFVMRRTQFGRALRAIAESPKAAWLLGINVEKLFITTSFAAAALGGVAGVLIGLYSNALFPLMGQPMLHKHRGHHPGRHGRHPRRHAGWPVPGLRRGAVGGLYRLHHARCGGIRPAVPDPAGASAGPVRQSGSTQGVSVMSGFENFWAIYGNLVLTLGTNALLALSIWLTLACGMLAMANAAFMGIGAYAAALLTMNYDASFPVALAGGMLAPALVAALIGLPTLRLSGVYLAMATLGFGEVVRVTVLNTESITGGALGLNGIPQLTQWWHVILAVVIVLFVLWRVRVSRSAAPSTPSAATKPPPA